MHTRATEQKDSRRQRSRVLNCSKSRRLRLRPGLITASLSRALVNKLGSIFVCSFSYSECIERLFAFPRTQPAVQMLLAGKGTVSSTESKPFGSTIIIHQPGFDFCLFVFIFVYWTLGIGRSFAFQETINQRSCYLMSPAYLVHLSPQMKGVTTNHAAAKIIPLNFVPPHTKAQTITLAPCARNHSWERGESGGSNAK